ncbi:YaiI/YqxD family protein [Petroclostridium sp. X23]|uniref:YaiI/YqxD family protein n=1 Tax=Petroclostridium sp. X23 TaxID=3045146 RepID=UPI0024AD1D08|nr:YaiI/YqxD family protein [Petroclostridium sp. X23]WHH61723.1 YaiI/YqxD family protein [Petroclostridium sp. X23]
MKILVDADACPVKDIIVRVAKQLNLRVLMFIDTSHSLNDGYSEVTTVDKGRDSVDIALINQTQKNDIIITQDYGVAAMALAKQAHCINQNGLIYTNENIDSLLFERHLSQKVRRAGGKTGNPRKRTQEDNERFEKTFRQLCNTLI